MEKVLILLGRMDWLGESIRKTGLADTETAYRTEINPVEKAFMRLHYHTQLAYSQRSLWYGNWKNNLAKYDLIILFDVFEDIDIVDYIVKNAPHAKVIVYYYNLIRNIALLNKVKQLGCEIWSFDKGDSSKYHLKYNHQFFFELQMKNGGEKDKIYLSDIYFLGNDKGRLPYLLLLKKGLEGTGIHTKFLVVGEKRRKYKAVEKAMLSQTISYETNLKYVQNTKCILDVVRKGQEGMTLRVMEAIFFNKKLVTNNLSLETCDFYNKDMVYILGVDQRDIKSFILENNVCWSPEIKAEYTFESWLGRMETGKEF